MSCVVVDVILLFPHYTASFARSTSAKLPVDSDTVKKVHDNSEKEWRFNRFFLVYEYDNRPFLFPPLNILFYFVYILMLIIQRFCNKKESTSDNKKDTSDNKEDTSFSEFSLCLNSEHNL